MRRKNGLRLTGERLFDSIQQRRMATTGSKNRVRRLQRANAGLRRRLRNLQVRKSELSKKADLYENLFENSPDIVYYLNKEGVFIPLNESTVDVLGYDNTTVSMEEYVSKVVHPEDRQRVLEDFYASAKGKVRNIRGLTFRLIKRDGEVLWVELHSRMNYDENGEFLEEIGFLRDITERKQMDERLIHLNRELSEINQKLQAAYQWMRDSRDVLKSNRYEEDIGFLLDREGRIEWSSERALSFTGKSRPELIGSYLPALLDEASRDEFRKAFLSGWRGIMKPFFTRFATGGKNNGKMEVKMTRLTSEEKRRMWVLVQYPVAHPQI